MSLASLETMGLATAVVHWMFGRITTGRYAPHSARLLIHLALAVLIPPLTTLLVAAALAGVGIVLFFGVLLHVPHFHAEPVWEVAGFFVALAITLNTLWSRLGNR